MYTFCTNIQYFFNNFHWLQIGNLSYSKHSTCFSFYCTPLLHHHTNLNISLYLRYTPGLEALPTRKVWRLRPKRTWVVLHSVQGHERSRRPWRHRSPLLRRPRLLRQASRVLVTNRRKLRQILAAFSSSHPRSYPEPATRCSYVPGC